MAKFGLEQGSKTLFKFVGHFPIPDLWQQLHCLETQLIMPFVSECVPQPPWVGFLVRIGVLEVGEEQ